MVAVASKTKRKRKIVLTPDDNGRRMTLDEFTNAASGDGRLYELNRGVVEMAEILRLSHGQIIEIIRRAIYRYEDDRPGTIHYTAGGSEAKVMSDAFQSERHPDLMIYLHAAPNDKQPWAEWVPEIVVEVVSESSVKRDYDEKPSEYAEIGITEYLIVDPVQNTKSRSTPEAAARHGSRERLSPANPTKPACCPASSSTSAKSSAPANRLVPAAESGIIAAATATDVR